MSGSQLPGAFDCAYNDGAQGTVRLLISYLPSKTTDQLRQSDVQLGAATTCHYLVDLPQLTPGAYGAFCAPNGPGQIPQLHIPATGGPGTWTIFLNRASTSMSDDAIYRIAEIADQNW